MAEKFYVKTSPSGWNQVTNFFVKTAANSWSTVSDAYVKVSSSLWQLFYSSLMSPSQQVEIEYFFMEQILILTGFREQTINGHQHLNH